MARVSWTDRWLPQVYASDASLTGYGVSVATWDVKHVAEVSRVLERRRFLLGAGRAREHAPVEAGFELDSEGKVVGCRGNLGEHALSEDQAFGCKTLEENPDFPRSPPHSWEQVDGLACASENGGIVNTLRCWKFVH